MPPAEGTPIWFELNGTDPDAAQAFYEAVAGWRVAPSPMPEHGGYRIAEADGVPVAGIRRSMPEAPGLPGWAIHLATRDVDAVAARAVDPIRNERGWVTNSVSAAPVTALSRITEVLRIIREPFRLHWRPTMGRNQWECRLSGTRCRARAGSDSPRERRQPGRWIPWSRRVLP